MNDDATVGEHPIDVHGEQLDVEFLFQNRFPLILLINITVQVSRNISYRKVFYIIDLCRPFRANKIFGFFYPGALPWAIIFCPFRAWFKVKIFY